MPRQHARRLSRQQYRLLTRLPLPVADVRDLDGNKGRTAKSLIDNGLAAWDRPALGDWALLRATAAGDAAVAAYKARQRREKD